jgi:hypothetical protein
MTVLQELINDFTALSKGEGDSGFVGRSVLAIIQNKKYLEKEKEQIINSFLKGKFEGGSKYDDASVKYYEEISN